MGLIGLVLAFPGSLGSSYNSSYRTSCISKLLCAFLGLPELPWASFGFSVLSLKNCDLFNDLAIALTIALDVAPGLHVLF